MQRAACSMLQPELEAGLVWFGFGFGLLCALAAVCAPSLA